MASSCVFCRIVTGEARAEIYAQWDDAIAITPLYPVTPGHLLVVPIEHVTDFTSSPELTGEVMRHASWVAKACGGSYNLITSAGAEATQTVFHLHVHLVPRRAGDGLLLPWSEVTDGA